jgi:Tol biopolymer transport system component
MLKSIMSCWFLVLAVILYGCSVNIAQTPIPASTEQSGPATSAVPPPSKSPSAARGQSIGDPHLPSMSIPATWSTLNLTGKLVYMHSVQTSTGSVNMSILALDLASGQITTVFQAPDTAWIDFVSVAPDESKLVMAYVPPRGNNQPGGSQQALYTLPLDGSSQPQLLFVPANPNFQYFQPTWSPDSKYIYFSGVDYSAPPQVQGQHYSYYELYRMAYPGGQPEKLVDEAYWPRLSHDGARLAYVTLDPVDGTNKLFVANPDGTGVYQVQLAGQYVPPIIDSPFFTPDDQDVLYSAVTPTQSRQKNWVERLLGVTVAYAHTVPSDWWSVAIGGGTATQLTHIAATGLYASLSPDQTYLVSYSGNGLFVMKPDGTQLTMLVTDTGGVSGTVTWIP